MKIKLNKTEEIELSEQDEKIWENGFYHGGLSAFLSCVIAGIIIALFATCNLASAQSTRTIYRQTSIIHNGKLSVISDWQKVTVNYLDVIYEYDKNLKKRRKALIVFGKEGTSALTEWMSYIKKENDTIYNFKRSL